MGIKQEQLESGNVLRTLVRMFHESKSQDSLLALLRCLRDSYVWIPCRQKLSDEDRKAILSGRNPNTANVVRDTKVKIQPELLTNEDKLFFPVFSNQAQMGAHGMQVTRIQLPFLEAVKMARVREDIAGIVLDAYTQPFILKPELYDFMGKIPSSIDK